MDKKSIMKTFVSLVLLLTMLFQVFGVSGALTDYDKFTIVDKTTNGTYGYSIKVFNNGFKNNARTAFYYRYATKDGEKLPDAIYCIQPGKRITQKNMITDSKDTYLKSIPNIETTIAEKKLLLSAVFTYGETRASWEVNSDEFNSSWLPKYVATQIVLWEVVVEDRDENFNLIKHDKDYVASIMDDFSTEEKNCVLPHYNQIVKTIQDALKKPNFSTTGIEMDYQNGLYTKTLTDSNNVLSQYNITCSYPLANVSTNGNKVTISSTHPIPETANIRFERKNQFNDVKVYIGSDGVSTQAFGKGVPTNNYSSSGTSMSLPFEAPRLGKIEIQKVALQPELTQGNENYSLEGAQFEITSNIDGFKMIVITNANGYAETDAVLPFGTYKIKEIKAPKGYMLNTEEFSLVLNSATPVKNTISTASQTVDETPKGGYIRIFKQDAETGIAQGAATLFGAKFEIYDNQNILVDTIIFEDGKQAISKLLPLGTYSIVEKIAPTGYLLNTEPVVVKIEEGKDATVQVDAIVKDIVIKGSVEITKYKTFMTEDGTFAPQMPFEGVSFILKSKTNGTIFNPTKPATDSNGKITFTNLPYDTYEVIETTPDGFESTNIPNIVVSENGKTYYLEVLNKVQNHEITIQKKTDGNRNIEGIEFTISGTTRDGRFFNAGVYTDENGIAKITVPTGNYTLREIAGDVNKYYDIPAEQNLVVDGNAFVEIYNKTSVGEVSVEKYLQNINFEYTLGEGISFNLAGVSFAGYDVNETITTNANGIATFKNIPLGKYILTEVADDNNKQYVLNEPVEVNLIAKEVVGIKVMNDLKTSSINLTKYQKGNQNILVQGAEYTLFTTNGEVYKTATTDEEGNFVLENIPYGKYILRETKAPEGYLLNPEEFAIDVLNHAEVINITTDDELILTNIEVIKKSKETGEVLVNTEFTIFNADTDEPIATVVTDENGRATFIGIAFGNYVIRETNPPEGYANDSDPIYFAVNGEYVQDTVHEFRDSPLPQTGVPTMVSIFALITMTMAIAVVVTFGKEWKKRTN